MEEIINKPEKQFKDFLNDLVDYTKDSEEKSALIKEVYQARHQTKPAASLDSSIYSSAASSSSSTSSTSDSSTNSASSSSTSSTLSSPSQSNQGDSHLGTNRNSTSMRDNDNIEMVKMEDLGKTARILEHRLATSSELRTAANCVGQIATKASHSFSRSISLNGESQLASSSSAMPINLTHHSLSASTTKQINIGSNFEANVASWNPEPWKTISGKRDKRRKKPAEQPVLSQHIPGHKGEQEVDWLVKFIESGQPNSTNMSGGSNRKTTKGTKQQSRRLPGQTQDQERENIQRKPNKPSTTHTKPLQQSKQTLNRDQVASPVQGHTLNQRRAQAISNDSQARREAPQQTMFEPIVEAASGPKDIAIKSNVKRNTETQQEKSMKNDEGAVTFADHIRINDDDACLDGKYIFGFFDEQRQHDGSPSEQSKLPAKQNDDALSSKSKRIGQKHKLKHPKASLNSEQKRYKFYDNIDANSFNYHQILEFISNSWESTAKSHRPIAKHTGSS